MIVTGNPHLRVGVPAPSFYGDWESGTVLGSNNHNWQWFIGVDPDRITILSDGGARQGSKYARIETREGDHSFSAISESSSVSTMQDADGNEVHENVESGTVRYTMSVKFDPSWQTIVATEEAPNPWCYILEMHAGTGAVYAVWALQVLSTITFLTCMGEMANPEQATFTSYNLSNGSLNLGVWIDFIITVKYAVDNTGFVTVQRRDGDESNFTQVLSLTNIPTVAFHPDTGPYRDMDPSMGIYRNGSAFTSILYNDGFTRTRIG